METKNETKPVKKSLWGILKESMDKASSGCGPGCGCHIEKKADAPANPATSKSPSDKPASGKEQA